MTNKMNPIKSLSRFSLFKDSAMEKIMLPKKIQPAHTLSAYMPIVGVAE